MRLISKKSGITIFAVILVLLCTGVVLRSSIHSIVYDLFPITAPQLAGAQDATTEQEWLDREFAASGVPSLTMVVAQDGRFIWERSWGWADKEKRLPATPQTMYSLASISKAITATGLMILVERGQIDFDKPIDDYLGASKLRAYVGDARQATVKRVANHMAGLPIHEYSAYVDEDRRLPPFTKIIRRYGILVRPPGERFDYSNLGYGLLEQAISQTSKRDFEVFMRQEVFEPLRLSRIALGPILGMENETAIRYGGTGSALPFYEMDALLSENRRTSTASPMTLPYSGVIKLC